MSFTQVLKKGLFPIFNFTLVASAKVRNKIFNLDGSKALIHGDIPAYILKGSIEIHLHLNTGIISKLFRKEGFPEVLTFAEVSPNFKTNDSLNKENYRPVRVLSYLSKVLEKSMYKQLKDFMKCKLSSLLTG